MLTRAIILVAALATFGCGQQEQQKQSADVTTASIEVKTVRCDMCVATVTNALNEVEGVKEVSVDLKGKVATVKYIAAKATVPVLEQAIANAGYDANNVKRNDEAYHNLPKCCQ